MAPDLRLGLRVVDFQHGFRRAERAKAHRGPRRRQAADFGVGPNVEQSAVGRGDFQSRSEDNPNGPSLDAPVEETPDAVLAGSRHP